MATLLKLIPHLFAWFGIVLIMLRGFSGRRSSVMLAGMIGFVIGVTGTFILFRSYPGSVTFGVVKSVLGMSFILLWGCSVVAIYRSTDRAKVMSWGKRLIKTPSTAIIASCLAGVGAGAVCICRLSAATTDGVAMASVLLLLAAGAVAYIALAFEKRMPEAFKVSPAGMLAIVTALLLFSASSILRLDLFSPLSMKVMKGVHDFVHQFMESILIPDHLFVRSYIWKTIGLLFSKEVGFWGGMVIWFTPAILIVLAIQFERLPAVAHIRQGAQRRRVLVDAIRARRYRALIPVFALLLLAAATYQSCFPSVEYWDPKPLPVTAGSSGEIIIPKKGEINLEDGKLHKYIFRQGVKEARFFVLMTPAGELTVDLDACAICKPDGYGQAEGSVICYYCKTLIPLETVGKPGGCNPVPIPFTENGDSVVVDGLTLINSWSATVQATARVKEGGK